MEAPAKLVLLKLTCPLTQIPELAREIHGFQSAVRIPESVFVIRNPMTVEALTERLAGIISGRGTVLVASLGSECKLHGSDVGLNQVKALILSC
jgi:hypothetical protein